MVDREPEEQPLQEEELQQPQLQEPQLQKQQQLQKVQEMAQYEVKLKEDAQQKELDNEKIIIVVESDDDDKEEKGDTEMKEQPQQVPHKPQVPQEQNPQFKEESSGQVADASAAASSSSLAQLQQQYHQYYYSAAAARGLEGRTFWGCMIHGTPGLRCAVCDIEYWRHYLFFVNGYRYHGRVPPPPIPILPMPLHRPSFQGMPPNFPGGFGFGQQGGGGGGSGGGGNDGNWGNPHGAKRPRPE
ncbi:hypothetical protein V8C42DRAFT_264327 [Trichoderma barbatum]